MNNGTDARAPAPPSDRQAKLRELPSVDRLLSDERLAGVLGRVHRRMAVRAMRRHLDAVRARLENGGAGFDIDELARALEGEARPTLTRAINGLGVVLHTGLGRVPLSDAARAALADVGANFCSLEIDRETGRRGSRYSHIEPLLCELTGAEAAMVVNNNCAATMLILSALARGREVIVSRGQLIEIGGSFRIPDVMLQSGCRMVEVGTTNRTHLRDYRGAITADTALLLRVHTSNYRIAGFTKEVRLEELVALGQEFKLPVVDDLGSGALVDLAKYGLPREPLVQESIAAGADVVCFSGDKLIGATQAGIIVGRKKYIDAMKKHPLTRALRCGKLTYAVLERTLMLFLDEERAVREHALFRIMLKTTEAMRKEARSLVRRVRTRLAGAAGFEIRAARSEIGGGSLATESIESLVVAVRPKHISVAELAARMRRHRPPVFGRIEHDEYLLDFRTLRSDEVRIVAAALEAALGAEPH